MSILAIINSDRKNRELMEQAFRKAPDHDLVFLERENEILEYLNYGLPELTIINFSDHNINIDKIINQIRNDKWIFNMGIIGLFSNEKDSEEDLLKKYKEINVLALLDSYRLRTHLLKSVEIIEQNYQIIFQRDFSRQLLKGASGSFIIDNDLHAVPLYSSIGATILSQRGLINPDSKMHIQLALAELIVNAIEHGNCGISYEEKYTALNKGISSVELVAERLKNPVINRRRVVFKWDIEKDQTTFIIIDEGDGFDVSKYIENTKSQDKLTLLGRGIKLAAKLSSKLKYNAKGNMVAMMITHDKNVEQEVPIGFSMEQTVYVNTGDIVLKEGDLSNYLYYISSGTYEVLLNNKPIGNLSPKDIFMGEMSFLLNQRRSATIRATSPGKLIFLTQKTLINVIREYPHYGIFLSKLLAKRLVRSNEQVAERFSD